MRINRFLLLTYVLITFLSNQSIAQNTETMPIEGFLRDLEERFDVVFTYADENIYEVTVRLPEDNHTLDEYLILLESQTDLVFNKISTRYIAIQKKEIDSGFIVLTGKIIDNDTKEQLVGAVIYSQSNNSISDNHGYFSMQINPIEDTLVTIRYIGYKQKNIHPNEFQTDTNIITLTPDVIELEEVVVNYIATGIDKLVNGAIQMNNQNLQILPGLTEPDVLHTAQVLPGIQSLNETVSYINIRGGTNDQNLVLWEGVKMYQTGHFFGLISGFNSNLINKTTFIKNGTSAAYGEGVSGTIDMKLQDYLTNQFNSSIGVNMLYGDAIIKAPVGKKISLLLEARHSINSLILTPTYNNYYKRAFENTDVSQVFGSNSSDIGQNHDFYFYDASFKFLYDASQKDKIRLSFLNMKDALEYEESALINDTLYKKNSHLNQLSILSNLDYLRTWNNKFSTHISAHLSSYNLDGYNAELLTGQNHAQENEVLDLGIKIDLKNKIGKKIKLSNGYFYNEIGVRNLDNINKPDYSRDVKDVLRVQSIYSEAEFNRLFNRLYLRVGIRAVYLEEFKTFIPEPRVAMNFKMNEYLALELMAEEKSQYATQLIDYQSDFLGVEKRRWALSNNISIPVIKSRQLSLGIQYNRNHLLISIEGYKKEVDGIITPSQGFQNQFKYVFTTGKYDTEGIEALINQRFNMSGIWLNYSYSRNNYFFNELVPSDFPNNLDVRHNASLGGSYSLKSFEVSCGFNYRTGKPYTKPASDNNTDDHEIIYEAPNSSHLSDFVRLDISAKYNFNIKKVKGEFGLSVWNVLNRENDINIFYRRNDNNEIEQITQRALRITPNINFRVKF